MFQVRHIIFKPVANDFKPVGNFQTCRAKRQTCRRYMLKVVVENPALAWHFHSAIGIARRMLMILGWYSVDLE